MPDFEEIRQEHENWLNGLEALAVKALASGNWGDVYAHLAEKVYSQPITLEHLVSPDDFSEAIALINRLLFDEASSKTLPGTDADFTLPPTRS